jgi:hypothetical protein
LKLEQEALNILDEKSSKDAVVAIASEKVPEFDFLVSEDVPVFTDDITLYMQGDLFKCSMVIVDTTIFLLYREKMTLVTQPFNVADLLILMLSPSLPTTAAL